MQRKDIKYKVYFVTGGGTGGHIYPAVSIVNELKMLGINNIYYVGNKHNPEYEIVKTLGVRFLNVEVTGMPRSIGLDCFIWALKLLQSFLMCCFYAIKYGPDVVFATGGYVSAPMVMAAEVFKIPYVMHESDAHPGIVTRRFSSNATTVNLAFEEAQKFLKTNKICVLGNPVRRAFFETDKETARQILEINQDDFVVLIMGGSQGAKTINEAAIGVIEKYKDVVGVKIILQTGKKNFKAVEDDVIKNIGCIPSNLILKPYFDEMEIPIIASDIAVSRAGSLSISEIISAELPSILVPYPFAAANHQRINAKSLEDKGAAIYIEDVDLTAETLTSTIDVLINDQAKLQKLKESAKKLKKDNPSKQIVELVLAAVKKKL